VVSVDDDDLIHLAAFLAGHGPGSYRSRRAERAICVSLGIVISNTIRTSDTRKRLSSRERGQAPVADVHAVAPRDLS
jgi:hypothetical protein